MTSRRRPVTKGGGPAAPERLTITKLAPHCYRVGRYHVDLTASIAAGRCDCPDQVWRRESKGLECKHIRAAKVADATPLSPHLER